MLASVRDLVVVGNFRNRTQYVLSGKNRGSGPSELPSCQVWVSDVLKPLLQVSSCICVLPVARRTPWFIQPDGLGHAAVVRTEMCLRSRGPQSVGAPKTTQTRGSCIRVLRPKTKGFQKPWVVGVLQKKAIPYHTVPYHIIPYHNMPIL